MSLYLRQTVTPFLSLFTSASTLICCALPALFVTLGMGASLAGLVSSFPQLIWFSAHKEFLFAGAGLMLLLTGYLRWRSRNDPCPIDPAAARACTQARVTGKYVFRVSVTVYATGAFFAFVAPKLI